MEETLSKKEFNYLKTIDTLNTAVDKLTEQKDERERHIGELQKRLTSKETALAANTNTISSLNSELSMVRRDLQSKIELISEYRNDLNKLRQDAVRVPTLEREISSLTTRNNHNTNLINLKNTTIEKLEKDKLELREMNNRLKEEIATYEDDEDDNEDLSEDDDNFDEGGKLLFEEQYEEPAFDVDYEQDQHILKLVKGGGLTINDLESMVATKNKTDYILEKAIDDALLKGKGSIEESELKGMKGVVFDTSGITVVAKAGTRILKRSFLKPSFTLKP